MIRKLFSVFLALTILSTAYGQSDHSRRLGVVSLRDVLKQVPLQDLAAYCKTNDWGEAYVSVNARLLDLNRKIEKTEDTRQEQSLRDLKYRLEQERGQLESNIRAVQENVVRQYIAEEFAAEFFAILNSDDSFEVVYLDLEVIDITSIVISKFRRKVAEKPLR